MNIEKLRSSVDSEDGYTCEIELTHETPDCTVTVRVDVQSRTGSPRLLPEAMLLMAQDVAGVMADPIELDKRAGDFR